MNLPDGSRSLFGFAHRHPVTGGLSWLRSSDLIELEAGAGHALTISGQRYALGRKFDPADVQAEGEEAMLAFDALIGPRATGVNSVQIPVETDLHWLAACKIARHLEISPPGRYPSEVRSFLRSNLAEYMARRNFAG